MGEQDQKLDWEKKLTVTPFPQGQFTEECKQNVRERIEMQKENKRNWTPWIGGGLVAAVLAFAVVTNLDNLLTSPDNRSATDIPPSAQPNKVPSMITEIKDDEKKVTRYMETPATTDPSQAVAAVKRLEEARKAQDWQTIEQLLYRTDAPLDFPEGYINRMFGQQATHDPDTVEYGEPTVIKGFATEYKRINRSQEPNNAEKVEEMRMKFKEAVAVPVSYDNNADQMVYYAVQTATGEWKIAYDRVADSFVTHKQ